MAWIKRFGPIFLIIAGVAAVYLTGLHRYLSLEELRQNREAVQEFCHDHSVLMVFAFIGLYVAATALSLPGAGILSLLAGFLFGLWIGVLLVVPSATIGASLVFLAARSAFGDRLMAKLGSFGAKLERGFKSNAFSYMLTLRLIPAVPFWALNVAGAAFGMKLRDYAAATFLGIIPGSLVYVSIGNGLDAAFDAGEDVQLSGLFLKPEIIFPILGLIALSLAPVLYRKLKGGDPTAVAMDEAVE